MNNEERKYTVDAIYWLSKEDLEEGMPRYIAVRKDKTTGLCSWYFTDDDIKGRTLISNYLKDSGYSKKTDTLEDIAENNYKFIRGIKKPYYAAVYYASATNKSLATEFDETYLRYQNGEDLDKEAASQEEQVAEENTEKVGFFTRLKNKIQDKVQSKLSKETNGKGKHAFVRVAAVMTALVLGIGGLCKLSRKNNPADKGARIVTESTTNTKVPTTNKSEPVTNPSSNEVVNKEETVAPATTSYTYNSNRENQMGKYNVYNPSPSDEGFTAPDKEFQDPNAKIDDVNTPSTPTTPSDTPSIIEGEEPIDNGNNNNNSGETIDVDGNNIDYKDNLTGNAVGNITKDPTDDKSNEPLPNPDDTARDNGFDMSNSESTDNYVPVYQKNSLEDVVTETMTALENGENVNMVFDPNTNTWKTEQVPVTTQTEGLSK